MSEALEILKSCDAFLEGHFLLSSGRHSGAYCQMAYLQQYPDRCAEVMKAVADKVKEMDVDVIVGPAMGGIVYAYELARQTGKRAIFTERVDNVMCLKRFAIHPGEKCIIAEDVVTTGISSLETKRVIEEAGGICLGITCVVDRTKPEAPSPIPILASALKLDLPNYTPEECPICKEGKLPLVHLHWYDKEVRPGRKVGHLNLTDSDTSRLTATLEALIPLLPPEYASGVIWAQSKFS